MLTKVTITGADDDVKPADLFALSEEFPFVEWGTLLSLARAGKPRYPSGRWIERFYSLASDRKVMTSIHVCGELAKAFARGDSNIRFPPSLFRAPRRVQLNGFEHDGAALHAEQLRRAVAAMGAELILQVRSEDAIVPTAEVARQLGLGTSMLWDASGGRGIESFAWPRPPIDVHMGYAGGIKPSNIIEVVRQIGVVDPPYWLDMESGVRDERDRFDLARVHEVLTKVAGCVYEVDGPKETLP